MLQTLERNVHTFDAQVLTPAGAAALAELTGPAGLPFLPPDRQRTALENGQIIADYAGQPELQAAAALMPLYDDAPLPTSLRAAGYGADGQGAVLTPPVLNENYTQLRHFLRMALRQLPHLGRAAPYHRRPALLRGSLRPVPLGRADSAGAAADGGHRGHAHLLGPGAAPLAGAVPPPASGRPGALPRAGTRVRGGGFRLG